MNNLIKVSAIYPGGYDGSFGSPEQDLDLYVKDVQKKNAPNKSEQQLTSIKDLMFGKVEKRDFLDKKLPDPILENTSESITTYTESFEQNIDVYILNKDMFRENREEALEAISLIFEKLSADKMPKTQKLSGYKNVTQTYTKGDLINNLSSAINICNLNSKQELILTHLKKSIEKSKRPFYLFVYDTQEMIRGIKSTLEFLKHDITHTLKDSAAKDIFLAGDAALDLKSMTAFSPLGEFYKHEIGLKVYGKLQSLFFGLPNTYIDKVKLKLESKLQQENYKTNEIKNILKKFNKSFYEEEKNNSKNKLIDLIRRFFYYVENKSKKLKPVAITKWPDFSNDILSSLLFNGEIKYVSSVVSRKEFDDFLRKLQIDLNEKILDTVSSIDRKFLGKRKLNKVVRILKGIFSETYQDNDDELFSLIKEKTESLIGELNNDFKKFTKGYSDALELGQFDKLKQFHQEYNIPMESFVQARMDYLSKNIDSINKMREGSVEKLSDNNVFLYLKLSTKTDDDLKEKSSKTFTTFVESLDDEIKEKAKNMTPLEFKEYVKENESVDPILKQIYETYDERNKEMEELFEVPVFEMPSPSTGNRKSKLFKGDTAKALTGRYPELKEIYEKIKNQKGY